MVKEHISICVCTYRRPEFLTRLLDKLVQQQTEGLFGFSIVIVDNDREECAKAAVTEFVKTSPIQISYWVEPIPNIALARNKVVANAKGDYLAFIDDDEFPVETWLLSLFKACKMHNVAGVLGPVLPHFETDPPEWLSKGGFYDRKRHKTGFVMGWQESRTGNVLIKREIINGLEEVFNPQFGMGAEDQDFFRRMSEKGYTFIWCDEAFVHETVLQHRWKASFLIKRALLRGKTTFWHPENRFKNVAKSLIAVPLYAIALPFLGIVSHHHFMKYFVRWFDHWGRLLAAVRLNPISERNH